MVESVYEVAGLCSSRAASLSWELRPDREASHLRFVVAGKQLSEKRDKRPLLASLDSGTQKFEQRGIDFIRACRSHPVWSAWNDL